MTTMNFKEIKLEEIALSPMNPRKGFAGGRFSELVESIKQKGVIEPIIVRPVKGVDPYEIVAGERRYKASVEAKLETIPAIVRELTDDEAYDFMLIENLQRQDLTEREEAVSFKSYVGRHGDDGIPELAEKTGIQPGYIRSRVRVLELPAKVLKAWDDGKLVFGHLQQLLRLPDKEALEEMVKWLFEQLQWEHDSVTVKDLARQIDDEAPAIGGAFFKAAENCRACPSNSAVQKELFGVETKGARCLNAACFKKRQAEWLTANWKTTAIAKKHGTVGFAFGDDLDCGDWNRFGEYSGKPGKKCASCQNFISIIELSGKVEHEQVCVGDKGCCHAIINPKSAKEKVTGERDADAPRAAWHGEFFRDKFLFKRIPEELAKLDAGDPRAQDLLLAVAVHGNRHEIDMPGDYSGWVLGKKVDEKAKVLREIVEKVILSGQHVGPSSYNGFGTKGRQLVAAFLGIDLTKEYAVDQEYLEKKTKAEILAFGRKFKIFDQVMKKAKAPFAGMDPEKLKKTELVEYILKCGVNLVGLVPAEILKEAKKP